MPAIIFNLSVEQVAALQWAASRYQGSVRDLLLRWMGDDLTEAMKQFEAYRWEQRRRAIEADAVLATQVDAAIGT